jgi:hypothetical protein
MEIQVALIYDCANGDEGIETLKKIKVNIPKSIADDEDEIEKLIEKKLKPLRKLIKEL